MTATDVPRSATGLLADFCLPGLLESADVLVAQRLGDLGAESDERVLLAVALAVRAVRHGSVCVDLALAPEQTKVDASDSNDVVPDDATADPAAPPWPAVGPWLDAVRASPLVATGDQDASRPLRLEGGLLYLDRYWRQERVIADVVDERRAAAPTVVDGDRLDAALRRLFPSDSADRQRLAAAVAAHRRLMVLAGGPGTGKTTTVARLLAVLRDQPGTPPRIALAAPTGKAAARLEEAVRSEVATLGDADRAALGDLPATTIHRLLGWRPGSRSRFRHDRHTRLPYDVVVVDEASMVSLTLMARIVDALRDEARLVLVGDPDQLASVEAGAVLGDLVRRPAPEHAPGIAVLEPHVPQDLADLTADERDGVGRRGVVTLSVVHRHEGEVRDLAGAVREGLADDVLALLSGGHDVELRDPSDPAAYDGLRADVVAAGLAVADHAEAGGAAQALEALAGHRLLCAHRSGPFGVGHWSREVERWLREARDDYGRSGLWYVGRPLLVTSNDRDLGLYNGDNGVVVRVDGHPQAVFPKADGIRAYPTNRLADVATLHAMSVHKSQGSQFGVVTVLLPDAASPLLTRELLYTAVTRAQRRVRVIGTEAAVRAGCERRIQRASGLGGQDQSQAALSPGS